MPVLGPTISKEQVNQAFQDCVKLLQEKYHVLDHPPRKQGLISIEKNIEDRMSLYKIFEESIANLFWQDACETW